MMGVLKDSRSFATDLYRVSQSERQKGPLSSMSGTDEAVSEVTAISRLGTRSSRSSPLKSSRASSSALEHRRMSEFPKMAAAGMQGTSSMSWPIIGASPIAVLLSGGFPFSMMDSSCGEGGGSCIIMLSPSSLSSSSSSSASLAGSLQDGLWEAKTCSSLSFSFSRSAISVWRVDLSSSSSSVSWGEEGHNQKNSPPFNNFWHVTHHCTCPQLSDGCICRVNLLHTMPLTACRVSISSLRLLRHLAAAILFLSLLILRLSSSSLEGWNQSQTQSIKRCILLGFAMSAFGSSTPPLVPKSECMLPGNTDVCSVQHLLPSCSSGAKNAAPTVEPRQPTWARVLCNFPSMPVHITHGACARFSQ